MRTVRDSDDAVLDPKEIELAHPLSGASGLDEIHFSVGQMATGPKVRVSLTHCVKTKGDDGEPFGVVFLSSRHKQVV